MKVAIASDHGGINLRQEIISLMEELNIEYVDLGCECSASVDYPDYALPLLKSGEPRSKSRHSYLRNRHRYEHSS